MTIWLRPGVVRCRFTKIPVDEAACSASPAVCPTEEWLPSRNDTYNRRINRAKLSPRPIRRRKFARSSESFALVTQTWMSFISASINERDLFLLFCTKTEDVFRFCDLFFSSPGNTKVEIKQYETLSISRTSNNVWISHGYGYSKSITTSIACWRWNKSNWKVSTVACEFELRYLLVPSPDNP